MMSWSSQFPFASPAQPPVGLLWLSYLKAVLQQLMKSKAEVWEGDSEMSQLQTYFLNNVSVFSLFQKSCQSNGIWLLYILSLQENTLSLYMYFTGPTLNYVHEVSNACCFLHAGGIFLGTPWCCEDGCLLNITVQERACLCFSFWFQHSFPFF